MPIGAAETRRSVRAASSPGPTASIRSTVRHAAHRARPDTNSASSPRSGGSVGEPVPRRGRRRSTASRDSSSSLTVPDRAIGARNQLSGCAQRCGRWIVGGRRLFGRRRTGFVSVVAGSGGTHWLRGGNHVSTSRSWFARGRLVDRDVDWSGLLRPRRWRRPSRPRTESADALPPASRGSQRRDRSPQASSPPPTFSTVISRSHSKRAGGVPRIRASSFTPTPRVRATSTVCCSGRISFRSALIESRSRAYPTPQKRSPNGSVTAPESSCPSRC